MKVTEQDLRQLYEESTVPGDAAACLDTDLLIRAANKTLSEAEREAVAGPCPLFRCAGYRIARSMRGLTDAPSVGRVPCCVCRRRCAMLVLSAGDRSG